MCTGESLLLKVGADGCADPQNMSQMMLVRHKLCLYKSFFIIKMQLVYFFADNPITKAALFSKGRMHSGPFCLVHALDKN